MSNLKCPFCQQELEETMFARGRVFVSCNNPNCIISDWGGCSKQIITELIRTRKALDVAKDTFNWIDETYRTGQETEAEIWGKVQLAAQEITALTKGGDNE